MYKGKNILGIIPARGGSKAIPKKNIKLLNGKPLIAYTIEEALKSSFLDEVIVSTDSGEIAEIAKKWGAKVPFLRPKHLAKDNVPVVVPVSIHAIEFFEKNKNFIPDIVVILQPTSPFRKAKYIDACIKKLADTKADWVTTIFEVGTHPFRMYSLKGDKMDSLFKGEKIWGQRQDFPKVYALNGAVYATWRKTFFSKKPFLKKDWRGIVMDSIEAVDIDNFIDFVLAESILSGGFLNER